MEMNPPIKLKEGTYQTRPPRSGKKSVDKILSRTKYQKSCAFASKALVESVLWPNLL